MSLVKVEEVALILGVTERRVRDLVREELLPAVRLGRQLRFDLGVINAWVARGGQDFSAGWRKQAPRSVVNP